MIKLLKPAAGPIGVICDGHSVRMAQTCAEARATLDTSSFALDVDDPDATVRAMRQAYESRKFRGRDAVLCLPVQDLFLQNLRVPLGSPGEIRAAVLEDVRPRLPFSAEEAEIRYVEAGDVRHADAPKREVVVVACHRPRIEALLRAAEDAQLNPIAVDTEPGALIRSFHNQFRRGDERQQRSLLVHLGPRDTCILITQDDRTLLAKHFAIGSHDLDQAVAEAFELSPQEAGRLRKRAADDGADDELADAVGAAVRQVVERLCREVSLCVRYFCVTFRSASIERFLLCGPEAEPRLAEALGKGVGVTCQCSRPFERLKGASVGFRPSQWDLALGLALRGVLT